MSDSNLLTNFAMHTSHDGVDLIKTFTGVRYTAHHDDGVWTIGFKHTKDVHEGMAITPAEADQMLWLDLEEIERYFQACVTVPLTQNQFDALVSFCHSLDTDTLRRSDLLSLLNAGQYDRAADVFLEYTEDDLPMSRRRAAERGMFLRP